ncbi:MAG: hypothetical protein ACTSXQ_07985 [Alphaproteobacteria bacterium]
MNAFVDNLKKIVEQKSGKGINEPQNEGAFNKKNFASRPDIVARQDKQK